MKNILLPIFLIVSLSYSFCQTCANRNVALQFDGIDDYLSFPSVGVAGNFSVGFWVEDVVGNPESFQTFLSFVGDSALVIGVNQDGFLLVSDVIADFGDPIVSIGGGKCNHIAYVSEGNNRFIYLDFELVASYQSTSSIYGPGLLLGNFIFGSFNFFYDGTIDNFRLFNIALAPQDLCREMNTTSIGPNLLLSYDFQEGIGNENNTNIVAPNNTGLSNNLGEFVGFDLTGNESNYSCFSKEIFETLCENNDPCIPDVDPPFCITSKATLALNENGIVNLIPAIIDAGSFDACGGVTSSLSETLLTCENLGMPNIVTLTITDVAGNSSSCQDTIFVVDNIPPTCSTSPTTLTIGPNGTLSIDVNDLNIQAFDNCGVQRIELSRSTFTCADEGTVTIECEVFDFSGNSEICELDLTITGCDPCMDDTVPPVCEARDTVNVVLGNNGLAEISVQDVDLNSFDNCTAIDRVLNRTIYNCEDMNYDLYVLLKVTDQSGNSASCFSFMNIVDNVNPSCSASPTNLTIGPSGTLTIDATDLNLQVFDNCGVDRIELSRTTFTCADSDGVEIDCTVYDRSNNSIVCSISLSFDGCENDPCEIDEIPPACNVEDITVYLDNDGLFAFDDNFINGLVEENCLIASIELSKSQFNCEDAGYVNIDEIIVTACDLANNCTECSFDVLVVDIEPPSCYLENVVVDAKGEIGVLLVYDALLEDNCSIGGIEFSTEPGQIFECGEHVIEAIVTDSNGNKSDCFFALTVENCGECCGSNTGFLNAISEGFTVETIMPENPKCIVQLFPPALNECQSILQLDWDDGTVMNGNFPWDVDFIHEYTDAGNYEVCITYAEASSTICFEEQVCREFEITNDCSLLTSVNTQVESALTIYPNPCRDILKVDIDNQNVFNDIVVYNINGQSLLTFDGNERQLDVSSLTAGLYYLHIIADDYSIIENFIKVD